MDGREELKMNSTEKHARWLIGQIESGRMSRRAFMGRTAALGMTLGAAPGLLSEAQAATPKRGGHMRLAMGHGGTSDTLDPATIANGIQWTAVYGVSNTLTEVDCIDNVELRTLSMLQRNPDVIIEEGAGPLHYSLPMLGAVAPFDNPDLRKALKFAIDRQDILDKILFGHGVIGNDHPIGPSYRYHAADIEQNSYDPDKARYHWQQSGLGDITLDLSAAEAAFGGAVDAAVLYQASAKKAGININVVREVNDGYWSDVWMKKPWSASYWGGNATEDAMFSTAYAAGAAWNESQWDNPRFNELLRSARAELNEGLRAEMYREMQILLRDEGSVIIPMFANSVHARNDKIAHGDVSWVRGFDGRRIMERWWMV